MINFLAKLGNDGMLSPFILGRTDNNQSVLGMVESFTALGVLAGSLLATLMKPAKNRTRLIFITTGFVFAGNIIQSLTSRPWLWCAAAFGSYVLAAIMNVNEETLMREKVPPEMQGRVFSAKSTLQNFTIPPALLLGGLLADTVFEPFMMGNSPAQQVLSGLFGTGKGAGSRHRADVLYYRDCRDADQLYPAEETGLQRTEPDGNRTITDKIERRKQ